MYIEFCRQNGYRGAAGLIKWIINDPSAQSGHKCHVNYLSGHRAGLTFSVECLPLAVDRAKRLSTVCHRLQWYARRSTWSSKARQFVSQDGRKVSSSNVSTSSVDPRDYFKIQRYMLYTKLGTQIRNKKHFEYVSQDIATSTLCNTCLTVSADIDYIAIESFP